MANSHKNIVITPNVGSASAYPAISFTGADAVNSGTITLSVYNTGTTATISFSGQSGQLFSISDTMLGTIFSANDVSGIPSIEVLDSGLVKLAQYNGQVVISTATAISNAKLTVQGNAYINGIITATTYYGTFAGTISSGVSAGSVANALTIGTGLSGTAGTYNGSAAVTVSLNTATLMASAVTAGTAASASVSSQVNTVAQPANATYYPAFVNLNNASAGAVSVYTTSSFTINPSTGWVSIGSVNTPPSPLNVFSQQALGSVAGNYIPLFSTQASGGTSNNVYLQEWRTRAGTGSDWTTQKIHRGVWVDASFMVPGTSSRTWYEIYPANGTQSWGDQATTFMTLDGVGNLLVGYTTQQSGAKLSINGGAYINGILTATTFVGAFTGSVTGSSTQINTVAQTANATYYPAFVSANNASASAMSVYTTSSVTINPGTSAVGFSGVASFSNTATFTGATVSTSTLTGAVLISGGVGIRGTLYANALRTPATAIALGNTAGQINQGNYSIAIGDRAGYSTQTGSAVAIGVLSGWSSQGSTAVAIGSSAGQQNQGAGGVAVGPNAGTITQGASSIAVGDGVGYSAQGATAVAIGNACGYNSQGVSAIAIGKQAGNGAQGTESIAIGDNAGSTSQGAYSIALGYYAGVTSQPFGSIIISATSTNYVGTVTNQGLYIKPVRGDATVSATTYVVYYNPATAELTTSTLTASTATSAATAYATIGTHTAGTGLTGSTFNGSANQTWSLNTATLMATAVNHQGGYVNATTGVFSGITTVTNTTAVNSAVTGALQVAGGVGVGGGVYVGGVVTATNMFIGPWSVTTSTSAGNNLTLNGAAPQVSLTNGTANYISFNTNGVSAPTFNASSTGTKILLYPNASSIAADFAIGISSSTLWTGVPNSGQQFQWFAGTSTIATLSGTGTFAVVGDIIGFSSDKRLKTDIRPISSATSKVMSLTGIVYKWNNLANGLAGYNTHEDMVGLFAQDVQAVLPEAVKPAPFDTEQGVSKSGENYLTVQYEKVVPLLVEAIKEQQAMIEELRVQVQELRDKK